MINHLSAAHARVIIVSVSTSNKNRVAASPAKRRGKDQQHTIIAIKWAIHVHTYRKLTTLSVIGPIGRAAMRYENDPMKNSNPMSSGVWWNCKIIVTWSSPIQPVPQTVHIVIGMHVCKQVMQSVKHHVQFRTSTRMYDWYNYNYMQHHSANSLVWGLISPNYVACLLIAIITLLQPYLFIQKNWERRSKERNSIVHSSHDQHYTEWSGMHEWTNCLKQLFWPSETKRRLVQTFQITLDGRDFFS